jgi:transposase
VSAISTVNARGAFWYAIYTERLNAIRFVEHLTSFLRGRKSRVFLVLDRHPAHIAKAVAHYVQRLRGRLELHFLPGYAPELNPDEFVWNHLKRQGVSKKPLRRDESLRSRVEADLAAIQSNPRLVRSFFRAPSVVYTTDLLVSPDFVVSTPLAARQPKAATRVGVACAGAAEMDQSRELLLLLERCGFDSVPCQCTRNAFVEVRRRQLDGMTRNHPHVEAIELARSPGIPRPIRDDDVIMNAKKTCNREGSVRNLIHPHRARSRPGIGNIAWVSALGSRSGVMASSLGAPWAGGALTATPRPVEDARPLG